MRRIDALYTDHPFYGSRRIAFELKLNRKRAQRLMRLMGIAALGPKPRTSKPALGHKVFPYLLRGVSIERPNQVWAADITYVPLGAGFLYLVAIMDWASRAVLSWRLSNTMDVSFCLEALEEALARFGTPERHEVSGICIRRRRTGRMSLIAVGDRASKTAWFSLPRSYKGRIDWHTSDSSKFSGSMLPEDDPQIELFALMASARILLLRETPPRVEFMDPKASKMIASIELAVEGRGEIARAWSDPKGRGEKE
jgi:putative transposase